MNLHELNSRVAKAKAEAESKGFWKKLKKGLFMTHTEFLERLDAAVVGRGVMDDETLEYLEESLIATGKVHDSVTSPVPIRDSSKACVIPPSANCASASLAEAPSEKMDRPFL